MNARKLDPGDLPREERRSRSDHHLLALSGGGYRGLFTATVLTELEKSAGAGVDQIFDTIAGTSIGGILAIGLACGVTAADLAELIREHGPAIFRRRTLSFAGVTSTRYTPDGLKCAINVTLNKPFADRSFADIPFPLMVVAVDETTNQPRIFRTNAMSGGNGDQISTLDVALATSAAPTYFPPHFADGRTFVDGGLIANAPDLILLTEAMSFFGCELSDCHLLSVGTASSPRLDRVDGQPGQFGWTVRHGLIELILSSQEKLAVDQVRRLRPGTFLRIDARPSKPIALDAVSTVTTKDLVRLAADAVAEAQKPYSFQVWRRFVAARRQPLF